MCRARVSSVNYIPVFSEKDLCGNFEVIHINIYRMRRHSFCLGNSAKIHYKGIFRINLCNFH